MWVNVILSPNLQVLCKAQILNVMRSLFRYNDNHHAGSTATLGCISCPVWLKVKGREILPVHSKKILHDFSTYNFIIFSCRLMNNFKLCMWKVSLHTWLEERFKFLVFNLQNFHSEAYSNSLEPYFSSLKRKWPHNISAVMKRQDTIRGTVHNSWASSPEI